MQSYSIKNVANLHPVEKFHEIHRDFTAVCSSPGSKARCLRATCPWFLAGT